MKVKCIYNKLKDLNNETIQKLIKDDYIRVNDYDSEISFLEIGKIYQVYGMAFWENTPWYYVCELDEYPVPTFAGFFEVIDDRFSKYWKLKFIMEKDGKQNPEIVFKEWAEDKFYYERLLDDYKNECEIFQKYKKLMDEEF